VNDDFYEANIEDIILMVFLPNLFQIFTNSSTLRDNVSFQIS